LKVPARRPEQSPPAVRPKFANGADAFRIVLSSRRNRRRAGRGDRPTTEARVKMVGRSCRGRVNKVPNPVNPALKATGLVAASASYPRKYSRFSIADLFKRRSGDHRSDRERAAGPEGRAHHITHCLARAGSWSTCRRSSTWALSRKIASDEERFRLKRILQGKRPGPVGGFITRTAAEAAPRKKSPGTWSPV